MKRVDYTLYKEVKKILNNPDTLGLYSSYNEAIIELLDLNKADASTALLLAKNLLLDDGSVNPTFEGVQMDLLVKMFRRAPRDLWGAVAAELRGKTQAKGRDCLKALEANEWHLDSAVTLQIQPGTARAYRDTDLTGWLYGAVRGSIERDFTEAKGEFIFAYLGGILEKSNCAIINCRDVDIVDIAYILEGVMHTITVYKGKAAESIWANETPWDMDTLEL